MDIGTLIMLFFVAAFFDAVTVMVIRQGNQQSSPVIFRALVTISIGFTLAFALAAFIPDGDALAAVAITLSLAVLFASVSGRHARRMAEAGACTIYLDPNHLATFIARKTVGFITFVELVMTIAALGATAWIVMNIWG